MQRSFLSSYFRKTSLSFRPVTPRHDHFHVVSNHIRYYSTTTSNSNLKFVKLVMVTGNNNNKFYTMKQINDHEFEISYGRIGNSPVNEKKPMSKWMSTYNGKVKKGYVDQTHLLDVEEEEDGNSGQQDDSQLLSNYSQEERSVFDLVKRLSEFSAGYIAQNYTVKAETVSQKQLDEAQKYLDTLADDLLVKLKSTVDADEVAEIVKEIDAMLLALYTVIPRMMTNVKYYLVTGSDKPVEFTEKLLQSEQATLDVMRSEVALKAKKQVPQNTTPVDPQQIAKPKYKQLLEQMEIEMQLVTDPEEIDTIKKSMNDHSKLFYAAYRVVNRKTQEKYDSFIDQRPNKDKRLFWHGSRNENWLSILRNGLELRPANAIINGKMFGYGTYFADQFVKSLGYTSFTGSYWVRGNHTVSYLAMFDVHVGKQLFIDRHHSWCSNLNETELKRYADYDSVFARANANFLRNNEYIVYNQSQCTIRYLVEINQS